MEIKPIITPEQADRLRAAIQTCGADIAAKFAILIDAFAASDQTKAMAAVAAAWFPPEPPYGTVVVVQEEGEVLGRVFQRRAEDDLGWYDFAECHWINWSDVCGQGDVTVLASVAEPVEDPRITGIRDSLSSGRVHDYSGSEMREWLTSILAGE